MHMGLFLQELEGVAYMEPYLQTTTQVLTAQNTSPDGLTAQEAERRLGVFGHNKLAEEKPTTLFQRFLSQFADPMIYVLLTAAILSGITAVYQGESLADVAIILGVVVLNAVMGVVQERKAEQAIAALKTMTAATSKVLRNGTPTVIPSESLVPGDIILIESGDAIPADCRILECASLNVEEAALTGESVPVEKTREALTGDIGLGDRTNMLYMGSTVVYGRGTAIVCRTGMDTEMGKIATALTQAQSEKTPLQRKLHGLSQVLTRLVLGICAVMFTVGVLRAGTLNTKVVMDTFLMAVSLAVAAIPEGLAAVVTIVLSMGVTKMSHRNAVIRRLTAVETLGCAQVICSDKTGTLTQNKMTVTETYGVDTEFLAKAMALCSDAEPDAEGMAVGEPTECALVNFAANLEMPKPVLKGEYPRMGEAPFDSNRKMMSTLHTHQGSVIQFTKGAPDEILARCTHVLTQQGVQPMTQEDRERIASANQGMANRALRVLACGYRIYPTLPEDTSPDALEQALTFVGLTGMIDPIRPEAKDAVALCQTAGIRAVMITGDHIDTATAIGKELGILTDPTQAIPGSALDHMTDEQLDAVVEQYSVYARVQPEHKVRIVQAWKRKGKVTAMTGDGVNDAPAIQSADIGIGMGITGTDVTKNVADMILADDNFATIVTAVEEGRRIYANIQKAIQFLLSSNLSEVLCIFTATMLGFTILKPAHILWINLITDSIPALALGMEPGETDAMRQPPRNAKAGIFSGGVGGDIGYQGLLVALLTLSAYWIGHYLESGLWEITDSADGMTMAFLTMSMAEIFQSFNMRARRGSSFTLHRQNLWLWAGAGLAFALTTAVIYVPLLSDAFGFTVIRGSEYAIAFALAVLIIPLVEIVKAIQRTGNK